MLAWVICCLTQAIAFTASAQTERQWRSPASGDWDNAASWSGNLIPAASDTAVFGLDASVGSFEVTSSTARTLSGLNVSSQRPSLLIGTAGTPLALTVTNFVTVGGTNTPSLTLARGSVNTTSNVVVGRNPGQPGVLNIAGRDSSWSGIDFIGQSASGVVTVTDGATLTSSRAVFIGLGAATNGVLRISGSTGGTPSSLRLQSNAFMVVGQNGIGELEVSDGGLLTLENETLYVGDRGTGSLRVAGAGSKLTLPYYLRLAANPGSTAAVLIETGGIATTRYVEVGYSGASTLTIRDSGSSLTAETALIAANGTGAVDVRNGAFLKITGNDFVIGRNAQTGTALVTGVGSRLEFAGWARIGDGAGAHGALTIDDGATASVGSPLMIGAASDSIGTVNVADSGTTLSTPGRLIVGENGSGSLHVSAQSNLEAGDDLIVNGGTITVDTDADAVAHRDMFLNLNATVRLSGLGSTLSGPMDRGLGMYRRSTLDVASGAELNVGTLYTNNDSLDPADANLIEIHGLGSTVNVNSVNALRRNSRVVVRDGGNLKVKYDLVAVGSGCELLVDGATSLIDLGGRFDLGFSTQGNEGVLTLRNGGRVKTKDYVNQGRVGTVRGTGTIEGGWNINGTLSPGENGPGRIEASQLSFATFGHAILEIGGTEPGTQFDQLVTTGGANLNGTLELSAVNGFLPAVGSTFDVIRYVSRTSSDFTSFIPGDLGVARAFRALSLSDRVRVEVASVDSISPSTSQVHTYVGFTPSVKLIANLVTSDGPATIDATPSALYLTDNPAVLAVDGPNRLRAIGAGTTTLRIRYAGFETTVSVHVGVFNAPPSLSPGLEATWYDLNFPKFAALTPYRRISPTRVSFDGADLFEQVGIVFSGAVNVPAAGDYTFELDSDDGSRLYINGVLVINNDGIHGGRTYEQTVSLGSGPADVRVEYYERGGGEGVALRWRQLGGFPRREILGADWVSGVVTADYYALTFPRFDVPQIHWGQFVPSESGVYSAFDDSTYTRPSFGFIRSDDGIGVGLRAKGYLYVPTGGVVTFAMNADDAAQLFIDDGLVIQSPVQNFLSRATADVTLSKGLHKIAVDAHNGGGFWGLLISADGGGFVDQVLTSAMLFHGDLPPDLAPTADELTDQRLAGETLDVSFRVSNLGDGTASGPWQDRVFISSISADDPGLPVGVPATSPAALDPGEMYSRKVSFALPMADGPHWISVRTDASDPGIVGESDESNNRVVFPPIDIVIPRPDLVAEDLSGFSSARIGDSVPLAFTVFNRGSASASGTWKDRIYLSRDEVVDAGDVALGMGFPRSGPIPVDAAYQVSTTAVIPEVAPGTYKLLLSLDDERQLSEGSGESNNVRVLANDVQILPRPLPDLRVSNITPPSNASPGSVAEISYTVTNIGEGIVNGSWDETVYGSIDATIGDDVAGPTTRFSGLLLPGQSVQRRYNITVPNIPVGNYWLIVAVDTKNGGEIAESNETNNAAIVPVCFNCNTPNLIVSSVNGPSTGVSGASIDVTWTVTNTGLGNTLGSWIDRIVLKEQCDKPEQTVIAEFRRSAVLLAGASYTLTRSVTLPPELEGERHIAVTTDAYNELSEPGGEGDNTTCSPTATVVSLPPGPDLTVSSITPLSSSATFDGSITLRWIVRNIGNQPAAAPWIDRVFLSGNAVRDGDDFPLEPTRAATVTLQPDGEYTAEQTVQLPLRASLTAGDYHFIVVTDVGNTVTEQRESNQSAVSGAVHIERPPLPDLRVVSVSTPAAACPGSQVDVVYTIVNAGTAPANGSWVERIVASPDDVIGNDYFGSQLTATGPLAPGDQVTRQGKLTVPNDGLSYRAAVLLDTASNVFETDETNNGGLSASRATVGRPDLQPVSIAGSPTSVLADDNLRVTWGSQNVGLCPTPASFLDSVFLVSVDGTQSYLLGSGSHAGIVLPGNSDPLDQLFPVPGRIAGEFRIQVRTDTAANILEPNETNNSALSSAVITVAQPARPDLFIVPGSIDVPANGLVSSQGTVSYIVTNLGGADAKGPWIDRIVARRAGANPGPDIEIGTYSFNGTLQWGQMIDVSAPVTLPAEPGDYTVCVITDAGDRVNEGLDGGEDNNRECSLGSFNADGYRVVVTPSITDGQAGTPVTVTGYAEKLSTGQRVALDTPIRVRHSVRGFERILKLKADANGAFGAPLPVRLELLPNEAGRYVITGGPPGAIASTPEVIFTLHGLRATPTFNGLRVAPAYTPTVGTLELYNAGDVPLTNLRAEVVGAPIGLNVELRLNGQPLTGKSIAGQQTIRPQFQLSAPAGTAFFDGPVTINWQTDQGAVASTVLSVRVAPRDPALTADPGTLIAGMVTSTDDKPVQSAVQFSIKNTGGLPTGQIRVELPSGLPWMTLSSPATISSLIPDEESRIVLTLAPTISQPLGDFTGQLVLRFDNNTRSIGVPYRFTHRSDAVGSIEISTANEETYWAPGRPPLANAAVTVRDARTNQVMGTQTTGSSGKVRFDDLPEGAYYIEADRDQHRAYRGLAEANRSAVSSTTAFLSRQAVTYSWRVDPIQVEDRYRFVLDATFVTNVYKPVLDITVIDAPTGKVSRVVDLDDVGFERLFYIRIENKGLVDAQNVRLTPTDAPTWQVELLTSQLGIVRPGAANAVTVPMVIRRVGQFARSAASGGDCQLPAMGSCFDLPCDKVYTTCDAVPFRWVNVCTGPGGYIPPGGSGGEGGGGGNNTTFSNTPTFQCNTVCSCPDTEPIVQVITKCVGSDPVVLTAPCPSQLTWSVTGGPSDELGNCVPSLRLPSDKPRHYVVQAYCKCPEGSRLVATYDVYFVKVTIRDQDDGKALSPDVALKRWVGESVSLVAEVEPSDVTISRTQWSVPHDAITAYDPTATSSNGPEYIVPSEEQSPRLPTIYFAARATRELSVQLTLRMPHGAEFVACPVGLQVQVDAIPSVSFQFRMPHTNVLFINRSNATVCELQLLGSGSEAIAIMKKITEPLCEPTTSGLNYDWVEPASPSGTARPLQVIRRSDKTVVDYTGTVFTDTFLNRRDAGFPFRDAPTIGLLNDDGDDPNMGLDKNPVSASWSTSMSTWLLWKSDRANSIWIPATNINFGWEMAAVRGARGEPWTPTVLEPSSFGEYRPAGDLYGSFPEWTGVH